MTLAIKVTATSDANAACMAFIATALCRAGSEFQSLIRNSSGEIGGDIAVVEAFGEPVGWARHYKWRSPCGGRYVALEAFVAESWRSRGAASAAAAALRLRLGQADDAVAVFRESMIHVARRAGFKTVRYFAPPDWSLVQ